MGRTMELGTLSIAPLPRSHQQRHTSPTNTFGDMSDVTAEEATKLANEADARDAKRPRYQLLEGIRNSASKGDRGISAYCTAEERAWLRSQGFKVKFGAPSVIEWP